MRRLILAAVIGLGWVFSAHAQATDEPGIQDNSFLIEEACNQGPGVVQELQNFVQGTEGGSWVYSFTQE